MSVGYLAQSFDLLNVRDLDLIAQARQHCAHLIVGVHTDELVEARQGRRPVVPLSERMALVGHVRGVAEVVEHGDDPVELPLGTVVFAVDDETPETTLDVVPLSTRRHTVSVALREALRPVDREAVA
jgi:glycerol-3-phosphate cytidylyltransferase